MTPAVVKAAPIDVRRVVDVLQQAFFDDPVMSFLLPDQRTRRWHLAQLFSIELRHHHLPLNSVWTTPDYAGAALWSPPGHWSLPKSTLARQSLPLARVFGRHLGRTLRTLSTVEKAHPREPHWYLAVLGTAPQHQGQGVGSALLAPVLERCDHEGVAAYLESSKESNIPFYERFGFEVVNNVRLPGGPPVWAMWRTPAR